jgi:hypothetical protein
MADSDTSCREDDGHNAAAFYARIATMKIVLQTTLAISDSRPLFAAAFLSFALLGASAAQAEEERAMGEIEAVAQSHATLRGIEKSDIRRGHSRDTDADGDGVLDSIEVGSPSSRAAVSGGKALADVVKRSDQPAGSGARLGDPIPGIDLNCAPHCAVRHDGAGEVHIDGANRDPSAAPARVGGRREAGVDTPRKHDSDSTAEPVPALDANPLP